MKQILQNGAIFWNIEKAKKPGAMNIRCNEYFVGYVIKMAKTMCPYIYGIQQAQQDSNIYFAVK